MSPDALYVSYDGLTDSLGVSQVVPYVEGLARNGFRMTVLSFEKPGASAANRRHVEERLHAAGVSWWELPYHKTPTVPATAFDMSTGVLRGLLGGRRFSIVHVRSHVAGLVGLAIARLHRARLIFDMRGFWADERIEAGIWGRGRLYDSAKSAERLLFREADAVVSLTHAAKREVLDLRVTRPGVPVVVIPTCADLDAFQPRFVRPPGPIRLGYVGSFGGRYLLDETLQVFRALREQEPGATLEVLTHSDPSILESALARANLPRDSVRLQRAAHHEVPKHLAHMDGTICLIKPGYASMASCPTKLGESLAAGVPVLVNPGIGDAAEIVRAHRVGSVWDLSAETLDTSVRALMELLQTSEIQTHARRAAENVFSLDKGVSTYVNLYGYLTRRPRERLQDAFTLPGTR